MSAYDSMRIEDLLQRKEPLTASEEKTLRRLLSEEQAEREAQPQSWAYGGDMADVF